jgi:hypothetical protein
LWRIFETVYGFTAVWSEDLDGHRWLFSRALSPEEWGA